MSDPTLTPGAVPEGETGTVADIQHEVVPLTAQFPALGGDVQGEIEHRSAEPAEPGWFRRTFSLGTVLHHVDPAHPMHLAHASETVADAIRRGLHPKGDVHLVDHQVTDESRKQVTDLTYAVQVVPASVDHDADSTTTPTLIAQAAADGDDEGEDHNEPAQTVQSVVVADEPVPVGTTARTEG